MSDHDDELREIACDVSSCRAPGAHRVTLHHHRAPEYYRVCSKHRAEMEAGDVCRTCGKARAVSLSVCAACAACAAPPYPKEPATPCTPAPLASTTATATAMEPPSPAATALASASATTPKPVGSTMTTSPKNIDPTVLTAAPATSASRGRGRTSKNATGSPARGDALRQEILALLRDAGPDGLSGADLCARFQAHTSAVFNHVRLLRLEGVIEATIGESATGNRWRIASAKTAPATSFVPVDEAATARLAALRVGLGKLANLADDDASPDECARVLCGKTDETLLGVVRLELLSGLNKVSALSSALMPLYGVAGVDVGDGTELFLVVNQAVRRVRAAAVAGVTWDATVDGPVARLPIPERLTQALDDLADVEAKLNETRAELRRLHEATKAHGELAERYHELACRLYGIDPSEATGHPCHEHLVERIEALLAPKPPPAAKDSRLLTLLRARVEAGRTEDRIDGLVAEALLAMVDDLNGAVA